MTLFSFYRNTPLFLLNEDGGAGGGNPGTDPTPDPDPVDPEPGEGGGSDDINAKLAAARKDGFSRAEKDLLKKLGVTNLDEAKTIIETQRKKAEADMTEAEKAKAALAERDAQAKELAEKNRQLLLRQEFYAQASANGLEWANDQARKDAFLATRLDQVEIDDEDNVAGMDEVVKALQKTHPHLFAPKKQSKGPVDARDGGAGSDELTEEKKAELKKRFRIR